MNSTHISSREQNEQESVDVEESPCEDESVDVGESPRADESVDVGESPCEDEIFHLLQNERRRLVLRYLRNTDGPVRMRDVAEQVAAWEHDTTVEALTSTQRQRVYIPLYQSHLSKLDKAGIIEYQQSRGIVERKPFADQVDQYLQVEPTAEPTDGQRAEETGWDNYYLGAIALCYLVLLGSVFELPFVSLVSGIGLSAFILLTFTLLTAGRFLN